MSSRFTYSQGKTFSGFPGGRRTAGFGGLYLTRLCLSSSTRRMTSSRTLSTASRFCGCTMQS